MLKLRTLAFAALLTAPFCGAAFGQATPENRFTFSLTGFMSDFSFSDERIRAINAATIRSTDTSSMGWGIRAAYMFQERWNWDWSGEVGFYDHGSLIARGVNAANTATFTASIKARSYAAALVGSHNFNDRFSIKVRAGFHGFENTYGISSGVPLVFRVDPERGHSYHFGGALGLRVNDRWSLAGEVNYYDATQSVTTWGGTVSFRL